VIHNTNVKTRNTRSRRSYDSPLREEQAEATRGRILDALVRAMAGGLASLSVPAVAREAGVSIPTIYRHFGSKAGLIAALGPYVSAKAGLIPDAIPESIDDMGDAIRSTYRNLDEMDATLRAAMASQIGAEARQAAMPWRRSWHRDVMRRSAPDLSDAEVERLTDLSIVLMSSGTFRVFRDYLGLDADEAANRTEWALRTLVHGAQRAARGG